MIATATANRIQLRKGRRGISIVSSASRLLFALLLSSAPAFPFLLIGFAGLGYGTGLTDTAWNSWASSSSQPNVMQGILHGSFSVGCVAGPALATVVLRKSAWPLLYGLLVNLCYAPHLLKHITDYLHWHVHCSWSSWCRLGLSAAILEQLRAPRLPAVATQRLKVYSETTACGFVAHTTLSIKALKVSRSTACTDIC